MRLTARLFVLALFVALSACAQPTPSYPDVTDGRLLAAASDDGWLMYRRSYDGQGYAPFTAINPATVASLRVAFTYDTSLLQGHEAPPIVNGRTMFVTTPMDKLVALDAVTGVVKWTYATKLDFRALRDVCCDVVNRGVALYHDRVYMGTLDDRLLCLNAMTGKLVWSARVAPLSAQHTITGAPLIAGGKVLTGVAGGEYGARGFIAAFDPESGKRLWRRWTIPAPSEPGGNTWPDGMYKRGGGDTWVTGSYDPSTRTLFWGTGNPAPWFGGMRPGANLYSDSVLALDVDTGRLKWYFQYTPHDSWDYDGVNELVLVDIAKGSQRIPAIVHADRNGYFFALDRRNGALIYARPFVKTTTILGYTRSGHAILNAAVYPRVGTTTLACPSSAGGTNWYPMAYSPQTNLAYVPTLHLCATIRATGNADNPFGYFGEESRTIAEPGASGFGELSALDVSNGRKRWSFPSRYPWTGGVLATASGLVFSGNASGAFYAFDARTGHVLWRHMLSSGIIGVPTTYRVDGKQYVAVYAGYGGGLAVFGGPASKLTAHIARGGRLYVFSLP